MKIKQKVFVILIVAAVGILMASCYSISKNNQGVFPDISVPAKDFTSLGLVFTENVVENNKGEVYTYHELLKEAKKLGADTIVNIVIDTKYEGKKILFVSKQKETWYGSATAIKYVPGTIKEVVTNNTDGTTKTTEGIIMSGGKTGGGGGLLGGGNGGAGGFIKKIFKK